MSYDPKCYELAEAFLADEPLLNSKAWKNQLAQIIQDAIEGEISWMRREEETRREAAASLMAIRIGLR